MISKGKSGLDGYVTGGRTRSVQDDVVFRNSEGKQGWTAVIMKIKLTMLMLLIMRKRRERRKRKRRRRSSRRKLKKHIAT